MELFESLKAQIKGQNKTIVFPEAKDGRILGAVARLKADGLLNPILVGNPEEVKAAARERGLSLENIEILDPNNYDRFDEMVESFVERRAGKATVEQAESLLTNVNYFGTMLIHLGLADGMVSGAIHSTGDTIRPALQIIKTKPGAKAVSGAFLMVRSRDQEKYIFADCAVNIDPDAPTLASIAIDSAETAASFGIEPKVAMLSFSTKGSAKHAFVDKVAEATAIAKEAAPELDIDGELQFDAAYDAVVASQKAPESKVAGNANVFVFPDIQSGNIGYKIAQRLGGFEAIGPILQGLNKPVFDLSRGCNEEDVYKLAIVTAIQAVNGN
ncbi:MAG: phosphate acetyltransferase [Lactobacillales bacterium]|jgi:phosphate acetyltransferase|nr:phosphate acetyltransferase [Lactobacillales bacterium]